MKGNWKENERKVKGNEKMGGKKRRTMKKTWTNEENMKNRKKWKIRKKSNQKEGYLEELLFKYDELGNLIEKQIYKNGVFTTDIQILYNSKSKLLASVITRQVSTGFMMIIRFKDYQFYD